MGSIATMPVVNKRGQRRLTAACIIPYHDIMHISQSINESKNNQLQK